MRTCAHVHNKVLLWDKPALRFGLPQSTALYRNQLSNLFMALR